MADIKTRTKAFLSVNLVGTFKLSPVFKSMPVRGSGMDVEAWQFIDAENETIEAENETEIEIVIKNRKK